MSSLSNSENLQTRAPSYKISRADFVIEFPSISSDKTRLAESDPPAYEETILLQPITPAQNKRYDLSFTIYPGHRTISSGPTQSLAEKTSAIPGDWMPHFNPEGSPYYVHQSKAIGIIIVTDAQLHKQELSSKVIAGIQKILKIIAFAHIKLPIDCELYIGVDEGESACRYYLIDHESQTEFWLQDVNSGDLEIPQVTSEEHLKLIKQGHYWTHMEYFPHRPVTQRLRNELVDILRHSALDYLTSDSSTVPYDADQCTKFIQLIHGDQLHSPYTTCVIARIWVTICHHRFSHYYGEDYARLCRFHRRLDLPCPQRSIPMRLCSVFLFGISKPIQGELERLFVDKMVYAIHWRKFVTGQKAIWRESLYLSSGFLVANAMFSSRASHEASQYIGFISALFSIGAITSAVTLLHRYTAGEDANAGCVAQHLSDLEHIRLGFAPIAIIYSLPKALLFWSLIVLTVQILLLLVELPGIAHKILAVAIMVAIGWVVRIILSQAALTNDAT